ncbi:PAS domain-containing sensor histidine kinase [Dongia sedimenti]|uniref:histidine kinase n=1 Tax=Dongia sedimenti TaxID=3064282 RepID=A0ABU0YKC4_9PROT|nr:PAS domain-containing sensor histidine kinase [Rhodospirillaceae bacterium R-7]
MVPSPELRPPSRFALAGDELRCLECLRGKSSESDVPSVTRSFLLARGYIESFKGGVALTPRGRTALLCATNVQMPSNRDGRIPMKLSLIADTELPATASTPCKSDVPAVGSTDPFFISLVGAIQGPVFVKDHRLQYVYVNEPLCRLLGRTHAELINRSDFDIGPVEQAEEFRRADRAVMADGLPRSFAETLINFSGDRIPILTSKSRFQVPGREAEDGHYLLGMITDTTQQKRAESALRSSKIAAEAANRSKSSFLANMSHELRTPLNAIIGFSEVIKDDVFGRDHERYRAYADDIFQSGGHLLKLINDILDISKIDAGKYQLNEEPCDLGEAVSGALLFVRDVADRGGVALHQAVPATLPLLRADLRAVTQILINLVGNAVKFTGPGGRVDITATIAEDRLSVTVADTGIGMKASDIPLALAPFQQLDSAWERKYEGTGLGLPLTDALLKLHGGSIEIDSTLGSGTTVAAHFPADRTLARP